MPRKIVDPIKYAEARIKGETIEQSLLAAGKSPKQARKGMQQVSPAMQSAYVNLLGAKGQELAEIGKAVNPETMKHIILGRVAKGITEGSDQGVQMAKLGGQWKELDMWRPESATGIIVIESPRSSLPTLDADFVSTPQLPASTVIG